MSTAVADKVTAPPAAQASDGKDLWAILAGLRALFAFVVLATHVNSFTPHAAWLMPVMHLGAFTAVVGFFVISGYSIAHSIALSQKGFYARRALRIYPLYLLGCILAVVPFYLIGHTINAGNGQTLHGPIDAKTLLGNMFFLDGFVCHWLISNGPVWTLAIEVFFYILAPLFHRMKTPLLLAIIVGSGGLYYLHDRFHVDMLTNARHGLAAAMLAWAWLLGFVFYRHRSEWWAQVTLIGLGTFLLSRFCEGGLYYALVMYSVSMFVIITAPGLTLTPRWRKYLTYGGELSYPLYILHYAVLVLLAASGIHRSAALYVCVTIIVAVAAYHLIDVPIRVRSRKPRPVITQVKP